MITVSSKKILPLISKSLRAIPPRSRQESLVMVKDGIFYIVSQGDVLYVDGFVDIDASEEMSAYVDAQTLYDVISSVPSDVEFSLESKKLIIVPAGKKEQYALPLLAKEREWMKCSGPARVFFNISSASFSSAIKRAGAWVSRGDPVLGGVFVAINEEGEVIFFGTNRAVVSVEKVDAVVKGDGRFVFGFPDTAISAMSGLFKDDNWLDVFVHDNIISISGESVVARMPILYMTDAMPDSVFRMINIARQKPKEKIGIDISEFARIIDVARADDAIAKSGDPSAVSARITVGCGSMSIKSRGGLVDAALPINGDSSEFVAVFDPEVLHVMTGGLSNAGEIYLSAPESRNKFICIKDIGYEQYLANKMDTGW